MRKSKMMKALLVFGMSVVTATAMVGFAACDTDDSGSGSGGGGGTQHVYTGKYNGYMADANGHWHSCDDCDEEADAGSHEDKSGDGKCDTCGWEINHTFDTTKWEKNDNSHWHPATCGHSEQKGDEAAHLDKDADGVCDAGCSYTYTIPTEFSTLRTKEGATVLVADTFLSSTDKLPTFGGTYGTAAGVYTEGADGFYTKVENGATVMVDGGAGETHTIVDFGTVTPGVVEGYFEMTLSEAANSWTPVQFIGVSATKNNSEVIGLRTDSNKIKYRLDAASSGFAAAGDIATSTDTLKVQFSFNLIDGKVTIKIGETALANELQTSITELKGIRFTSTNSNARVISIDNLVVVNTPASAADYKEKIIAKKVTAAKEEMNADIAVNDSTADYKTAYDTAIAAADSIAACDAAYNTYYAALVNAYKANVKPKLQSTYPAANYTGENNKSEYEAVMGTAEDDVIGGKLASANTIKKVNEIYEAAVNALKVIHADGVVTFNVTIHNGEATYTLEDLSATDEVTEAMLNEKIGLASGKTATYYSDAEHTQELTLPTTFSGATDIYVVVNDVSEYAFTFAKVSNVMTVSASGGYDISGWSFTTDKSGLKSLTIPGVSDSFTTGVKLASSDNLKINVAKSSTVTIYFYCSSSDSGANSLKIDDGEAQTGTKVEGATDDGAATNYIYSLTLNNVTGSHTITRGGSKEVDIFYVVVSE